MTADEKAAAERTEADKKKAEEQRALLEKDKRAADEQKARDAEKAAADRARVEASDRRAGADAQAGARAMAEAIGEAAQRALSAIGTGAAAGILASPDGLVIAAIPGGAFTISGPGNLGAGGTLHVGGQQVQTTSWSAGRIKGTLPAGASGKVEVFVAPDRPPLVGEIRAAAPKA